MAKTNKKRLPGSRRPPQGTPSQRGGHANWAIFEVIDQHLERLNIVPSERELPPLNWGISKADWARWLDGGDLSRRDIDLIAIRIAQAYLEETTNSTRPETLPFSGLAALAADLEQAASLSRQAVSQRFFLAIAPHLKNLNWTDTKKLSAEWGCSEPLISGFRSGARQIQLDHVNRFAVAVARAYDELPDSVPLDPSTPNAKKKYGTDNLHHTLDTFLSAAGFSVFVGGRESNLVWNKLARNDLTEPRSLKAGFYWWPPLTTPSPTGTFQGLTRDITEVIARLMSVDIQWVPIRWPNMHTALANGDVDIIPSIFLQLPMRMFELSLSKQIPFLRFYPVTIVSPAYQQKAIQPESQATGRIKLSANNIVWVVGKSDVMRTLAKLLEPRAIIDDTGDFASIEDAWRYVMSNPWDSDKKRVRVIPTDQLTASLVKEEYGDEACIESEKSAIRMGVSFAAYNSEPKIVSIINACIDDICDSKEFIGDLLNPYRDKLDMANVIPIEYRQMHN